MMTDEQMRDLVKECGLDWQRGYMPLFDDDPTNRYAVLIEAVETAERKRWTRPQRDLAERAADMLTAYGELIRRDGASHVEEHHYLPEVEHTARELRCALGPNVEVQRSAAGRSAATQG
jgi:hypothetical protein